jgi:hypothetical protein
MTIEIQYFDGCPNYKPAVELAHRIVAEEGVRASVFETNVPNTATAFRIGFAGSPSIRVNGIDVEPSAREFPVVTYTCRHYAGGIAALEPMLRAAVRNAQM